MFKWVVVGVVVFLGLYLGTAMGGGIETPKVKASSGKTGAAVVLKGVYGDRAGFKVDNCLRYVKEGKELCPGVSVEKILEGGSRVILSAPEGRKVLKRGESLSGVPQKPEAIIYEKRPAKEEAAALPEKEEVKAKEYTVEKDDSLWKIAQKEYGDGNKWKKIYEYNKDKIKNPSKLKPGLIILIPE